jgi:hypothetical protein
MPTVPRRPTDLCAPFTACQPATRAVGPVAYSVSCACDGLSQRRLKTLCYRLRLVQKRSSGCDSSACMRMTCSVTRHNRRDQLQLCNSNLATASSGSREDPHRSDGGLCADNARRGRASFSSQVVARLHWINADTGYPCRAAGSRWVVGEWPDLVCNPRHPAVYPPGRMGSGTIGDGPQSS